MINKVGYTRPTNTTKRTKRTGKTEQADFAAALSGAEAAQETSATEAASPVASVTPASLLGIQEVSADESARSQATKQGRNTLDLLEKLRDGLLMGTLPVATVKKLEAVISQERATTTDPNLNAVLDEIEVRAAVELAKLEKSGYST